MHISLKDPGLWVAAAKPVTAALEDEGLTVSLRAEKAGSGRDR